MDLSYQLARIYWLARISVSALYLYAAAGKMIDLVGFSQTISAFGLIPESLSMLAAIAIVGAEVVGATLLLMDREGGLLTLFSLTAIFILVIGYAMAIGLDVDCGCFGPEDPEASAFVGLTTAFIRDWIIVAVLALIQGIRWHLHIQPKPLTKIS